MRGGSPTFAVQRWVAAGAPAELAPRADVFEQADGGPVTVELSPGELGTLNELLDAYLPMSPAKDAAAPEAERLLSRGILVRAVHGLALAPAYLWTIGIAAWSEREISVVVERASAAAPGDVLEYRLVGRHAVEAVPVSSGVRLSVSDPEKVGAGLVASLQPDPHGETQAVEFGFRWQQAAADPDDFDYGRETAVVAPRGDAAVWSSDAAGAEPEQLGLEELEERLRAAAVRGADFEKRAAEAMLELGKSARGWRRVIGGGAAALPVIELATSVLSPGLQDRAIMAQVERKRQDRAAEYWRLAPSFERR